MDNASELEKSLAKARAELRRARKAHSACLLVDPGGCAAEQEAVAAAERRVQALERALGKAQIEEARRAG